MKGQDIDRVSVLSASPAVADRLIVGKLSAPFGVKGWIKIHSFMQQREDIFDLQPWWIEKNGKCTSLVLESARIQGKQLVAKLKDLDDRTAIESLQNHDIFIDKHLLPGLDDGDFYWRDLEGLRVILVDGSYLGYVSRVFETGSNDVLVVAPDVNSVDQRERLIPYLSGDVVKAVDLTSGAITVDWDLDF